MKPVKATPVRVRSSTFPQYNIVTRTIANLRIFLYSTLSYTCLGISQAKERHRIADLTDCILKFNKKMFISSALASNESSSELHKT